VSEGKSTVGVELMFEVNSGVIPRRSESPSTPAHSGSPRMYCRIRVFTNPRLGGDGEVPAADIAQVVLAVVVVASGDRLARQCWSRMRR